MFDRKIKPLSDVYVGLVAQRRRLTPEIKAALLANSDLRAGDPNIVKLGPGDAQNIYETFYTFKFVYFSDRAMWQQSPSLRGPIFAGNGSVDSYALAEPPMKKQRPVHRSDAVNDPFDKSYDQFEPCSRADYRGMVGAWRIGKVLDTAARRKDQYMGGPVDTADQVTLNVNLEWVDWRVLRRRNERTDIGCWVSGAPQWIQSIPNPVHRGGLPDPSVQVFARSFVDQGDDRTLMWPTEYTPYSANIADLAKQLAAQQSNMPLDMQTMHTYKDVTGQHRLEAQQAAALGTPAPPLPAIDYARDGFDRMEPGARGDRGVHTLKTTLADQWREYREGANAAAQVIRDLYGPIAVQRRIEAYRRINAGLGEITDAQFDAEIWADVAAPGANTIDMGAFAAWLRGLDGLTEQSLRNVQAFFSVTEFPDAARWTAFKQLAGNLVLRRARAFYFQMKYFTDGAPVAPGGVPVTKEQMLKWLQSRKAPPAGTAGVEGLIPDPVPGRDEVIDLVPIAAAAERGITVMIEDELGYTLEDADTKAGSISGTAASSGAIAAAATAPSTSAGSGPMDTGEGVGLSFGIAAVPPPSAKGKAAVAPPRRNPDAPTAPTATTPALDTAAAQVAPKPSKSSGKAPATGGTTAAQPPAAAASTSAPPAAPRTGRPGAPPVRGQRAANEGTAEIFSTIFGAGAGAGSAAPAGQAAAAAVGAAAAEDSDSASDHVPSPAAASGSGADSRSRVRRARDGR